MAGKKELLKQRHVIERAKDAGGYAVKLAHQFSSGIPDLYVHIPKFAPYTIEMKDLGVVTVNFNRKIDITPLQLATLRKMQAPNPAIPCTAILVSYNLRKKNYLSMCPIEAQSIRPDQYPTTGGSMKYTDWDLSSLFAAYESLYGVYNGKQN